MRGRRTWLGWPLWLVSALLVVAAVTGSAGPVEVVWALGTVSVAVWMAGFYLSGWLRGRPRGHDGQAPCPDRSADQDRPSAGTTAGGGAGSAPA